MDRPRPDVDLASTPWDYPGPPAPHSGALVDGRLRRLGPADLRHIGEAGSDAPAFVVAVGSNASPGVLQRKLAGHGLAGPITFVTGVLRGCAVGHSAHVSAPGYVPAAPYAEPAASTPVVVLLLSARQVECLDGTEPNYVRRRVVRGELTLLVDGGREPDAFDLYDTRWGVLGPPGAAPPALTSQAALHEHLGAHWEPYAALLGGDATVEQTVRRLGADPRLRERVGDAFHATGWAAPTGLGSAPASVAWAPASGSSPRNAPH